MEFLVILGANIQVLSDIPNIANHNRLDALLVQRRDQVGCLLVFDILNLMLELLELLLLRLDEFLSSTRAFLLPINLLAEMLAELIAILPLRSEVPPVEDVRLFAIMGDSHVDLAQINPCYLRTSSASMRLNLIGGDGFVLGASPVDHHRLTAVFGMIEPIATSVH
jgi:hypothetical protein